MSTRIEKNINKNLGGEKVKKVIAIAATMVLGATMMASATQTNWTMTLKAEGFGGTAYSSGFNTTTIGTFSGMTAGKDSGEPGSVSGALNTTAAAATTWITGAAAPGNVDYKKPKPLATTAADLTPTWEFHVYQVFGANATENINTIKLTFTPSTGTTTKPVYNWVDAATGKTNYYGYKIDVLSGKFYTAADLNAASKFTSAWFTEANKMGTTFVLYADNRKYAADGTTVIGYNTDYAGTQNVLRLTLTPEPGSMLALGSGLAGLLGFAIRRKR